MTRAPRSFHPFPRPRATPSVEPLAIIVLGLLASIAIVIAGLAGYAGVVVIRGLLP